MKQELFEIYKRNFPFNIREEEKEISMLSNPNNYIIEKRNKDNILIGVSVINKNTILVLCVDEEYRNQGIGTYLLEESEKYIQSKGYEKLNFGEGYDYIMPGIPIKDNNISFFEKKGYYHSWKDCECFDMAMEMTKVNYPEKLGDTINGVLYRFATEDDIEEIRKCVEEAEPKFVEYYLERELYSSENDQRVLIAIKDGEVCGTLIVSIETEAKDTGSVGCTTTKPKFRHQGIATNMVKIGTKYLKDIGMKYGYLGYTYTGLDKMYGSAGYHITTKYMMAEKQLPKRNLKR